jgi:hypothetical protein
VAGGVLAQQRHEVLGVRSPAVLSRVWSVATGIGWARASAQAGALAVFAWPLHRYRPETAGCENGAVSEAAPCAYVGVGRPPLVLSELGRIYT